MTALTKVRSVTSLVKKDEALAILDGLRADVASGKLKAFSCIGIAPDHTTFQYQCSVLRTSNLEMMGAVAMLARALSNPDDE